jgi:hypothetical protein
MGSFDASLTDTVTEMAKLFLDDLPGDFFDILRGEEGWSFAAGEA